MCKIKICLNCFFFNILAKNQRIAQIIIELIPKWLKINFVFKKYPLIFEGCYLQQRSILHSSIFIFEAKIESELCIV
jgi:hypothetical protein